MDKSSTTVNISLLNKLKPFATEKAMYKVAYGGRGSAKSWTIARILLLRAMQSPIRVLCAREILNSISHSVHTLLETQIKKLGLTGFIIQNNRILHVNGSEFYYKGLFANVGGLQSLEDVDVLWIEEGQYISAISWHTVIPSIRKEGSEIWISMNPRYKDDIVYSQLIHSDKPDWKRPSDALVINVNWHDNPFFPDNLKKQKEHMKKTDPDQYLHIWEGKLKQNTNEQVMKHCWVIEEFESNRYDVDYYFGSDFGFSKSPNTLVRCYIDKHPTYGDNCLYIEYEACDKNYNEDNVGSGLDIDKLHILWDKIPLSREYTIIADSARPETISYMNNHGFSVKGAHKGKGSVEEGVMYIRGFDKVIIHPRCVNTAYEFDNYKYKVNINTGEITDTMIDAYNHMIDAIRYALEPVMKSKVYDYSEML